MHVPAFASHGRFWRGNLHTHTTSSDGRRTAEDACAFYRENGYDFVAITDHFIERYGFPVTDTRPYRSDTFTTLLGAELHTGRTEFGLLWHILAVGLPPDFAPYSPGETGPDVAARALAAGAFVAAAHPSWYGLTEADVVSLGAIHASETFNATAIDHNDRAESWSLLDLLLTRGRRYSALATDDAHFEPSRHDFGRAWVQVKSATLDPESLLTALKAGDYYSSTGPAIHDVRILDGGRVVVRCSPAARIFASGHAAAVASAYGNGITTAELSLSGLAGSPYFRITVRDDQGGRAWSNPIPL
jgi:hypothetical protein